MSDFNPGILVAWLHDPPDKALDVRGNEARARRYLAAALGHEVAEAAVNGRHEDSVPAVTEQLPLPSPGQNHERAVGVENGVLKTFHPLSAQERELTVPAMVDEEAVERAIDEIVGALPDGKRSPRNRFLALWRLLPGRLAKISAPLASLPADPRIPDHTIWHHLDITAGLQPVLAAGGGALILLSIGPVQPFIAAARTVRDLWSGSMILSYLAFHAMLPIIEQWGPTAIVFPALRGVPMLDLWLRAQFGLPEERAADGSDRFAELSPSAQASKSPCLPNRFLAIVPWGPEGKQGRDILDQCIENTRSAWRKLASDVRYMLRQEWSGNGIDSNWDARWDRQIETFFEVRGAILPLQDADDEAICQLLGGSDVATIAPDVAAVRALAEAIPAQDSSGARHGGIGRWQLQNEIVVRLLEAQRQVRHVPPHTGRVGDGNYPAKCTLLGSFEHMGPADREESGRFWADIAKRPVRGIWLRSRERLCAVSLTKRFAPIVLAKELGLRLEDLKYSDTATVAAAEWLAEEESKAQQRGERGLTETNNWSGQWLYLQRLGEDEEAPLPELFQRICELRRPKQLGPPPLYYAVLTIDGDEMGEWLAGRKSPAVSEVIHPKLREYFDRLAMVEDAQRAGRVKAGLDARLPLGPARHAAISEALANYALHVVPRIVERHHGTLIYAGGDDVLALLPCRRALQCAYELRLAFSGHPSVNDGAPVGYHRVKDRDSMGDLVMMGPTATLSAGIAVVHYKEDLRLALQAAREAEKEAKRHGRDAAHVIFCRRSGEHSAALCPWNFSPSFQKLVEAFSSDASDRWAYHLHAELDTLVGRDISLKLVAAEIRRQLLRAEKPTIRALAKAFELDENEKQNEQVADRVVELFSDYYQQLLDRGLSHAEACRGFITLCQGASFLARGGRES